MCACMVACVYLPVNGSLGARNVLKQRGEDIST